MRWQIYSLLVEKFRENIKLIRKRISKEFTYNMLLNYKLITENENIVKFYYEEHSDNLLAINRAIINNERIQQYEEFLRKYGSIVCDAEEYEYDKARITYMRQVRKAYRKIYGNYVNEKCTKRKHLDTCLHNFVYSALSIQEECNMF